MQSGKVGSGVQALDYPQGDLEASGNGPGRLPQAHAVLADLHRGPLYDGQPLEEAAGPFEQRAGHRIHRGFAPPGCPARATRGSPCLARSVTARSTETLAQMPPLVMLPPRPPG
jgi:hypothetical protein